MAFAAPRIILPDDGSTHVDPLSPIMLLKSDPWEGEATTAEGDQPSVDYSNGWTNIANMVDGNVGTFATATAGGAVARLDCSGVNFAADDAKYVANVFLRLNLKKTFTLAEGHDQIFLHWHCTSTGEEMDIRGAQGAETARIDDVTTTNTVKQNDEPRSLEFARDYASMEFMRRVLGKEWFTVAELEAALDNIYLTIHVQDGIYGDTSQWDVSNVAIRCESYDSVAVQTRAQWQVSTDNTFASVDFDWTVGGAGNHFAIPAGTIDVETATTYYVQARAHDGTAWSSYTASETSFTVMPMQIARMFHDENAVINVAIEADPVYYLTPGAWAKTGGYTNIYEATVSRNTEPLWPEVVIPDIYEAGKPAGYTRYFKGYSSATYTSTEILAALDAGAKRFWWDDENDTFYIHCTGSVPPSSFEGRNATRGKCLGLICRASFAESEAVGGADDEQPYLPKVLNISTLSSHMDLWPNPNRAEGNLKVDLDNSDGWFYKRVYPGDNLRRTHNCLVWHGAAIRAKAIGVNKSGAIDPEDAPVPFTGNINIGACSFDDEKFFVDATPRLSFYGITVPKKIYSIGQFPSLLAGDQGTVQPEYIGEDHRMVRCVYVGHAAANQINLHGPREIHNVTEVYKNGVPSTNGDNPDNLERGNHSFSWSDANQIITVTSPGDDWDSAEWSCDCDGIYNAGTSNYTQELGEVVSEFLTSEWFGNLPSSAYDSTSITALTTTYPGDLRFGIDDRIDLADVITTLELTGRMVLQEHLDGTIHAAQSIANRRTHTDFGDAAIMDQRFRYHQHTVTFYEYDIDPESWTQRVVTDTLASYGIFRYWGYAEPEEPLRERGIQWSANDGMEEKYHKLNTPIIEFWKKDWGGVTDDGVAEYKSWLRARHLTRSFVKCTFEANKKAWLVRVGDPVLVYRRLTTERGPGTTGAVGPGGELDAALMLVLSVDRQLTGTGGTITAAYFEPQVGWKAGHVPRLV